MIKRKMAIGQRSLQTGKGEGLGHPESSDPLFIDLGRLTDDQAWLNF